MDEINIHANADKASGDYIKWKRETDGSENIYQYEDTCHTGKQIRTGPALSGTGESRMVEKSSYKAAAVILGLLCLLLLIGLMSLVFLYTKGSSKKEIEMVQLQTNYNNLTEERDQLQTSYNNLTKERDQLQTSYNNLTEERDQLQTSYNNLAKERDQLQTSYNNLTEERDQLNKKLDDITTDLQRKLQGLQSQELRYFSGSFYYISSSEKSWEEGRNDCRQKGTDLVIINSREEQDFIRGWKKRTWIGLTDEQTEGTWRWVDGTVLTTPRFWAESEPNNEGDEDCAEIKHYDSQNSWNDVPCNVGKYWICEISLKNYSKVTRQC
ncbi:C-type lectin domain family 4 member M-like isoform X2 [Anabas testudineus]|uniref:C-type lectin domain family 4 member M-like isoform X2 n=1 Tax=Anabas testudineus TaxID=64144 RepID=UPI000E45516F|nr:C-type lectin domain family 4 member M-like isoform X2 [Anabas testudineus]